MLLEKLKIKYDDDNEQYSRRSLLSYSCHWIQILEETRSKI